MVKLGANIHSSFSEVVTEDLRRRNVITVVDFVVTDPVKLATFTGLSHMDILQVKQHILKKFGGTRKNASELLIADRKNVMSTGVTCLDKLLKGGLYPGQLCEICGLSASGKTQLCFTIAANAVARSNVAAWYLDTKRDFSRLRFEEILRAWNLRQTTIQDALQRTKVCRIRSSHELIKTLRHLVSLRKAEQACLALERRRPILVIVDSLPAVIFKITRDTCCKDYETTYELDDLAEACRFLARECQAMVITVNSVTRWDSDGHSLGSLTPALGKHWARMPVTRLLLTREDGATRRITVWKDPRLEENSSCIVSVGDVGIVA